MKATGGKSRLMLIALTLVIAFASGCGSTGPSPGQGRTSPGTATGPAAAQSPTPSTSQTTGYTNYVAPGLRNGVFRNERYGFLVRLGKGWIVLQGSAAGVTSQADLAPLHYFQFVTAADAPFPPDCSGGIVVCRLPSQFAANRVAVRRLLRSNGRGYLRMEGDALFPLEQGFRLSSVRVETLAGFPALEGHFRTVYGGVAPTVLTSVVVGTRYLYYIEFFGVSQPKVQERLFERIARSFTAS